MTILEKIKNQIEIDKENTENRYWSLKYTKESNDEELLISTYRLTKHAVFMNDILNKDPYFNPYLVKLFNNHPIEIHVTETYVRILYDKHKLRKYKIDKLLNT